MFLFLKEKEPKRTTAKLRFALEFDEKFSYLRVGFKKYERSRMAYCPGPCFVLSQQFIHRNIQNFS